MEQNIWVVVPACNEEKTLSRIISGIKQYSRNIIIIDDGSKDSTYTIAKKANVIVLKHAINLGKGAALKTGCDYALSLGAKKIIVMDADAQHDPQEIPMFVESLATNDIVFGYRKLNKNMPLVLKLGNFVINKVILLVYGMNIKDSQSGYRAFTAKAYKKIRWSATDYSMESEMIANAGKHKLKYAELPIETIYSDRYKGTTIIDGIKIVKNLFVWKLIRRI